MTASSALPVHMETLSSRFFPHKVVAPSRVGVAEAPPEVVRLLADRPMKDGRPTIYICERMTCQTPVVGVAGLLNALGA